jgi:hypothetical protein
MHRFEVRLREQETCARLNIADMFIGTIDPDSQVIRNRLVPLHAAFHL